MVLRRARDSRHCQVVRIAEGFSDMYQRKLTWLGIAAAAIVGLGLGNANAAIIDLGTTSPLTLSGVPGLTTLVSSPSPDTDTKLANNVGTNDFANLFLP